MNTYTRFLREEEAHFIFKKHLKHHFPADEVKPWKSIARMWKDGCYFAVGVFEDGGDVPDDAPDSLSQLRGYAFFVESPDCDACLLDYYAILPEYRDAGLGGHTLQRLAELCRERGDYILIETEDIDFAKTEEEVAERTRRDRFYLRNGCRKTDTKNSIFGVKYAVWALGLTDPAEDAAPAPGAFSEAALDKVCEDMDTLYQLMIPGEKNKLFVKVRRA